MIVAPECRGFALSVVVAGLTASTALGSQTGALIAGLGDWRWTMVFVATLAGVAALGVCGVLWAVPDTLVGTDSHTPMVNALGVLGWGVGGLEAEGVMFGVPVSLRIPEVVGVRLVGAMADGAMATDLALAVTQRLRQLGVSGEFVEYFGPGIATLTVGQRAVTANMAPEYGASTGCYPIDQQTLSFLRTTGRTESAIELVEAYARANGLWYDPDSEPRYYGDDRDRPRHAASIGRWAAPAAGPVGRLGGHRRPDHLADTADKRRHSGWRGGDRGPDLLHQHDGFRLAGRGWAAGPQGTASGIASSILGQDVTTPGSPSAVERLRKAGLLEDLEAVGFAVAGFGCATCIGNSGPLLPVMQAALREGVTPVAVLSGNRNFPGRVHVQVDQALLASPPLVIAYALAGHARLDITRDALGTDAKGHPVHLSQLWPSAAEIAAVIAAEAGATDIQAAYATAEASATWLALSAPDEQRFPWDPASTYLRRPPFVRFAPKAVGEATLMAHPLLILGDDITTDHISPAGAIHAQSDAGQWLIERGEDPKDLNVYASRRGNWEVMLRGLFTNKTVVNHLLANTKAAAMAGRTAFAPTGENLPAWQAAERYAKAGLPLVLIAGERYGTGSSRDWAAKGVQLLGVRAVLANSFERIHRANLVCMGVLPLQLPTGWRADGMGLVPGDLVEVDWNLAALTPRCDVAVRLHRASSCAIESGVAIALLDTEREVALVQAAASFR
jgi:aconitate hydratase